MFFCSRNHIFMYHVQVALYIIYPDSGIFTEIISCLRTEFLSFCRHITTRMTGSMGGRFGIIVIADDSHLSADGSLTFSQLTDVCTVSLIYLPYLCSWL